MPLKEYVIGGMDRGFKLKLYHALRKMDAAGHMPGITSAFRDDYRQAIASGNKAASDSSYHGGSRRGGYGRGLAADLVSLKGANRMERFASSELLWRWIDANEKELELAARIATGIHRMSRRLTARNMPTNAAWRRRAG